MSAGTTIADRYSVGELVGAGGLAAVHRATDAGSGAPRAIKLLHPQYGDDVAVRDRFLNEARTLRRLSHPGIVKVYDAGRDGQQVYLVTELVEGETLRERLDREGALPPPEVRRIGAALASALAHAHEAGVVHRDVKPQNVLLEPGPEGAVKLADFGSARVQSLAGLTGSSLVWGSPEYMAPELFGRGRIDPRSDLYSLGVLLHEMASGRLPWVDENPLARLSDVGGAIDLASELEPEISELITSLLQTEPSRRPSWAEEVRAVLEGERGLFRLPETVDCSRCGESRATDVEQCVQCGFRERRIAHAPGQSARLVLTRVRDESPARMEALHELLEALTGDRNLRLKFLTGDQRLYSKRERAERIKLPVTLFSNLHPDDAEELRRAFAERGWEQDVRVVTEVEANRQQARAKTVTRAGLALAGTAGAVIGLTIMGVGLVLPGALVATAGVFGAVAFAIGRKRLEKKRKELAAPGRFQLLPTGANVPRSDRLLETASNSAQQLASPEVKGLLGEVTDAVYRLSRRAEELETGDSDLAVRLLEMAPRLQERVHAAARRLDGLDTALDSGSETAAVQSLARLERRLATADPRERTALADAYDDALATVSQRHRTQQDRARIAAGLVQTLADLRDLYRRASQIATLEERELAGIEEATRELDRLLGEEDS